MKKVVIIGGGFAGSLIARKLENKFNVILIDDKDYFEFTPGVPRTVVEPEHIKRIQKLHTHYLKKAEIVQDKVVDVTQNHVFTTKNKISYDYLAICSGSTYNKPFKECNTVSPNRASTLRDYNKGLNNAERILIVGGGPVGVEFAAEIVTHYKDKNITIVQAKDTLLERQNKKARDYAYNFLVKRGCKIIFNERVIKNNKNFYLTDKNRKIKADLVIYCTGITTNFEFLTNNFSKRLDENNQLTVNEYLLVDDTDNIFAAGDISNIKEEKLAQNAENHALMVIRNICNLEKKANLIEYVPKPRIMVISLGKYNGILTYKNLAITGLFPGILKSLIEIREMMKLKF